MSNLKKILFCIGTRPEAIKLASLIHHAQDYAVKPVVCITGQHKELLKPFIKNFKIPSNFQLDIMKKNQSLNTLMSELMGKLDAVVKEVRPEAIFVQGDTSTAYAGALTGFYSKVPVLHVEAGLRTYNKYSPFPEELHRKMISHLADYHFSPTEQTKGNLEKENITNNVYVTGNTSIDALKIFENQIDDTKMLKKFKFINKSKKMILVTTHRRENMGKNHENIFSAMCKLSEKHQDIYFVLPLHLNPEVKNKALKFFNKNPNVQLIAPAEYDEFIWLMKQSYLIMTDSGGVQEEAPFFNKPVLVLRDTTERPEAINSGCNFLAGTDTNKIFELAEQLLTDQNIYKAAQLAPNPYGDGYAFKRIYESLAESVV